MDGKIQKKLAEMNGKTDKLYGQNVRKAVGEEFFLADEIAILRKAVDYLFDLIATLHAGEINNAEFAEYNAKIEQLKNNVKTELGIKQNTTEGEV